MGWAWSGARSHWRVLAATAVLTLGVLEPAAPSSAQPSGPDHRVLAGDNLTLCGAHHFGTLTVEAGGTLAVAGGPDCPVTLDAGTLIVEADRIVNHGTISADATNAPPFTPPASACPTPPYSPPTGNGGGGHVGRGGDGGIGTGGSSYDANCPVALGGAVGLRPGAPGAGTGPGGRGGGVVVLVSNGEIHSDGLITANGEAGVADTRGSCAHLEPAGIKVVLVPNSGVAAPRGGGAGGSIVLAGRTLDLRGGDVRARGGRGGDSRRAPSGAGGSGAVRVMGPLTADAGWVPDVGFVAPVGNGCPMEGDRVIAGGGQQGEAILTSKVAGSVSTLAVGATGTPVRAQAKVAGAGPTGTVTFRAFSDGSCATEVFISTNPLVGGTATSSEYAPAGAGTYWWTASYGGDDVNDPTTSACGAPGSSVTVSKADTSVWVRASPGNLIGAPVRAVATVVGGIGPTGTVTFALFSDAACAVPVFTSTAALSGPNATSAWFTPVVAGTYRWTATYDGDDANGRATSGCNTRAGFVTVSPFQPPTPTRSISGDVLGPVTVGIGESVTITDARVAGPVTVNPGGSLMVVNSQVSMGMVVDSPAFLSLCGAQVSASGPGAALTVSSAIVPIRIGDPANGCPGNRFAGALRMNGNLAVMFGANVVSHHVTVDQNGPGDTVVKANTVFGTLACACNSPPPTNAAQPNTAAARTGQCAGL